jgi:hypothetical protein
MGKAAASPMSSATIVRYSFIGKPPDDLKHCRIVFVSGAEDWQLTARGAAILANVSLDRPLFVCRQAAVVLPAEMSACFGIRSEDLDITRHRRRTAQSGQRSCNKQHQYYLDSHGGARDWWN